MKTKTLYALTACMSLVLAAQVSASSAPSAHHPFSPGPAAASAAEPVVLPAATLDAVKGTGDGTDFACGALSGAALAAALTGVGIPVAIGLAVAGFLCSLLL